MSILCIDSGNTRIKWGLREGDAWTKQGTGSNTDIGALSVVADRIVASNVAGDTSRMAIEALAARLGVGIEWVQARAAQCGVTNGYEHPEQLGADRWAALIGARALHHGDCLVVMCGTATTIDVLTADGHFQGGLILPGLAMMHDALASGTADLPAAAGQFAEQPRNTFDAIASGAMQATAGAIERMFRQLDPARAPLCLLSGGAAGAVPPRLTFAHRVVDNLVLEGLARCATSSGRPTP
jgi:type III pantothenate kinase